MLSSFSAPFKAGRLKIASIASTIGGSLKFNATAAGQLNFSNSPDINLGTGDFTVEWWQYQTDNNGSPRPWGIGPWSGTIFGVSIESGSYYLWHGTGNTFMNFGTLGTYKNQWVHLASVRQNGQVKTYKNGIAINSGNAISNTTNITSAGTKHLTLGGEGGTYSSQTFGGYITNFHIMNSAKYTSNFTPSMAPITPTANSLIVINATDDATKFVNTGTLGITATANSSVLWDSNKPA